MSTKYNLDLLLEIARKTKEELEAKKKPLAKPKEDVSMYFEFLKKHRIIPGTDKIYKYYLETWFESWYEKPYKTRSLSKILKLRVKKDTLKGKHFYVDIKALNPKRYERNKAILKYILKKAEDDKEEKSIKSQSPDQN